MKRKKFIQRIQQLGQKAAEVREAVQRAPGAAAQFRETVAMTLGEFQQLRGDVQSNLTGLRADNEDRLIQAMRDINASAGLFEQAGYELSGIDLDLTINRRFNVELEKVDDVPESALRSLLQKETRDTIKSILAGILKAEQTAAKIDLTGLIYDGLKIQVGSAPVIRMCWRKPEPIEQEEDLAPARQPETSQPAAYASPAFGSFFQQQTTQSSLPISAPPVAAPPAPEPAPVEASVEPAPIPKLPVITVPGNPWSQQALDRFKKMPDVTKYRRS